MEFDVRLFAKLEESSKNYEKSMDKLRRKQIGSYFTSLELTVKMMDELISEMSKEEIENIYKMRFLEPCVGTGNFVFAYILGCVKLGLTSEQVKELINNIYVCDINEEAIAIYRDNLTFFALEFFGIALSDDYYRSHIGGGLLFNVGDSKIRFISLKDVFGEEIAERRFDIVATNPPYKNLKAEHTHYIDENEKNNDKSKYYQISELAQKHFQYSTTGTLNLYKLFVEEIIENYLTDNGKCSLLIPSSILSDKTCSRLRNRMLFNYKIISIKTMGEDSSYVDAQQALCAILLKKGQSTDFINISKDYDKNPENTTNIHVDDLTNSNCENAIVVLTESEYRVLEAVNKFPKLKDITCIKNLRGELDLSIDKNYITSVESPYRLIRGRNIGLFQINRQNSFDYVSEDFIKKSPKGRYVKVHRIACQQIANQSKKKRVIFSYIKPNTVLGNSCNFIVVNENNLDIDLDWLIGVLNSSLINWLFKLTSSNNHINNYELDALPLPIYSKNKNEIRQLVKKYIEVGASEILDEIEELVCQAYEISSIDTTSGNIDANSGNYDKSIILKFYNEIKYILPNTQLSTIASLLEGNISIEEIIIQCGYSLTSFEEKVLTNLYNKYLDIKSNRVLNHTLFKLSDLDLEMIKPIPQGGNWKNIPQETISKSKRLERIKETGGRTTLYGRIDYKKPSYTITTYFNRPGNGTYVHPIHNRVITVREAARFQSFNDDYYFCGNKNQQLKQVGNAVPVLLAYQIAKNILGKTGCSRSLDLFCGAGGMTAGFKAGGINSILSTDIEESACMTLKVNNPEIPILCGDITNPLTKSQIVQTALENEADIICGGPPCQGFSMAGFRQVDDPRNQLFRDFADIVSKVKPKIIVFENVEGLLTFQNGETYRNIIQLFSELGYNANGRTLFAHHFGVPQKRKRVILICTRKDLSFSPDELFPEPPTISEELQITAYDTISDLENIGFGHEAVYKNIAISKYVQLLRDQISHIDYFTSISQAIFNDMADIHFKATQLRLF
ncbi:Alw26I/Eco31I/Esp3I family type II restriction adenine-specific DNA-methyltransferase [Youngiibacter multivorans]|uniref:Cytosine-specific methyltransferase n=1 Tax=Youngiibacter multivorans TaxID=937251 RepID=A0ABS4G8Q2_9CLOT|nr:Alw26I/Eco31I/Esp3I family type II restriction adenine-specific DNA-methyltransferase [Youngiibacter multivorans]MBP1920909.1 DNA-cytosine methyltransferase [Youngiibacter multivorans]